MEVATTRNSVRVTCSPQVLESFYHREVLLTGNKETACELGLHPTTLSRDKVRIVNAAIKLVHNFGVPEGSVAIPDYGPRLELTGEAARALIAMLDHIREKKAA